MNNFFLAGLLSIGIIALSACKESVDLKSSTYNSSQTTSTSTTIRISSQDPNCNRRCTNGRKASQA